jgi:hypothetical protein
MSIIYRIKTLVSIDQKRQYCDEEAITENQQKKTHGVGVEALQG